MALNFRSLQDRLRQQLLSRINAGELTGMQLARATGFQQAHISNFLNRKRGLSLEAMDAILEASGIPFAELLPNADSSGRSRSASPAECADFLSVPIVNERICIATQVPNQSSANTIKLALNTVQRMSPAMFTPRPHWQRFVAIRVKPSDAAAMSPRLTPNSIAVVDRHHNSPPTHPSAVLNLYLIRIGDAFAIRYLEHSSGMLVARAHRPEFPIDLLRSHDGLDPAAAIVGRICLLQVQP